MDLWMDLLFGNAIGLLSLGVIAFTIGMAIFFIFFYLGKSKQQ